MSDKIFNAAVTKLQDIRDRIDSMKREYSLMHLAEVNWLLGIACGLGFVVEADEEARRLTPAVPVRWVSWEFQLRDRLDALDRIIDAAEKTLFDERAMGIVGATGASIGGAMTQMLNAAEQSFKPLVGAPCNHPQPHMGSRCIYCGELASPLKDLKDAIEEDTEDPA